jgi:hypothetical protein
VQTSNATGLYDLLRNEGGRVGTSLAFTLRPAPARRS